MIPYEDPEINEWYRKRLVQIEIEEEEYRESMILAEIDKNKLERSLEEEKKLKSLRQKIIMKMKKVPKPMKIKLAEDFNGDIAGFKSAFEKSMQQMMPKLEYYFGPYQNEQPLNISLREHMQRFEDDFNITPMKPSKSLKSNEASKKRMAKMV